MKAKSGKNILVADDSEFFRMKLSKMLITGGHWVRLASDGEETVSELQKSPSAIDLLVVDLRMPKKDGFGVLKWIRDNAREGNPPVLVVTGVYEVSDVLSRVKELGAGAFMTKDAPAEHFIFRVNKLLYTEKQQRDNVRVLTDIPVDFTCGEDRYTGRIVNLSRSGIFLSSMDVLNPGDITNLRFLLPYDNKTIVVVGKVIWANNFEKEEAFFNGMGIHFEHLTYEDRLCLEGFVQAEMEKVF